MLFFGKICVFPTAANSSINRQKVILQRNISIKNVVLLAQCDQADDAQGALATSRTNQTRFARETQRLRVESERFSQERRRDKSLEEKSGGKESGRVLLRDGEEKTRDGIHEERTTEQNKYTEDELKLMKTQDVRYVSLKAQTELKRVQKMKETLHCLGAGSEERKHTIFVDEYSEAKTFKPEKYFDTPKELIGRAFNRPKNGQLEDADQLVGVGANEIDYDEEELRKQQERRLKKVAKLNRGAYKMLNEHEERAEQLKSMTVKMALQKEISYGKGVKEENHKEE